MSNPKKLAWVMNSPIKIDTCETAFRRWVDNTCEREGQIKKYPDPPTIAMLRLAWRAGWEERGS